MEMMNLFDEDPISEHDVAWMSKDWDAVQKLADSYKEKTENELFSILNDITVTKKERNLSQCSNYSKTWIDLALSQHVDCLISVNAMNLVGGGLSDQDHYNYYLNSISEGKRYGKWAKITLDASETLINKVLMLYYSINSDDAEMYREILTAKNKLKDVLHKAKSLVSDELIKTITKNVKEQKNIKNKIMEW